MLKRLYANNFRCLVNTEIEFDQLTLLLGPNGGGKSTFFEVIYKIRHFLLDLVKVEDVFSSEDLTAWVKSDKQQFELDVLAEEGLYSYKLIIVHESNTLGIEHKIEQELLTLDGSPLSEFSQGKVTIYTDDNRPSPSFNFDPSLSPLMSIGVWPDRKKITRFKEEIEKLLVLSLQPRMMTSETVVDTRWLGRDGKNFASWYRYISQEHQDKVLLLTEQLRDTLPGFYAFKLEQAGKSRILRVGFVGERDNSSAIYFDFEQLSDGQRVIIVLYSLLLGLQDLGYTVFIDEPENYVALAEIQPWLMELNDACGDGFPQAVLISHHPELIDYLGPESGKYIEREPLGPTRIKKMPVSKESILKLSEQIARGWNE